MALTLSSDDLAAISQLFTALVAGSTIITVPSVQQGVNVELHQGDAYPAGPNPAIAWTNTRFAPFAGKLAQIYVVGSGGYAEHFTLSVYDLGALGVSFVWSLTSANTAAMPIGDLTYEIRVTMNAGIFVTPFPGGTITVKAKLW